MASDGRQTEVMDTMTALAFLIGFGVIIALVAAVGMLLRVRHKRAATRDDTMRAGSSGDLSSEAAARRAQGTTSWMRPGGGV
jgi:hypothetical protein